MAAGHPQRVSLRCDQFSRPLWQDQTQVLGSWILELEESSEVPGNVLRLEGPLRISSPGSNVEGGILISREWRAGMSELTSLSCLTFTSAHGWMDGLMWIGWEDGSGQRDS